MRGFFSALMIVALCGCAYWGPILAGGGAAGGCVPGAVNDLQSGFHNGGTQWAQVAKGILTAVECVVQIEEAVRKEVAAHRCTSPSSCGVQLASASASLPSGMPDKITPVERDRMNYALMRAKQLRERFKPGITGLIWTTKGGCIKLDEDSTLCSP